MALYIPPRKTNTGQNVLFFFEPKICVRLFYLTTVAKMFNVFFKHALKKYICLHLQALSNSNNYHIIMINICLITTLFFLVLICIRVRHSS